MVVLLAISPGGRATRVGPAFSNRLGRRSLFVVTLRLNNGVWAVFAPETVGEGGSQRPTWSPQAVKTRQTAAGPSIYARAVYAQIIMRHRLGRTCPRNSLDRVEV